MMACRCHRGVTSAVFLALLAGVALTVALAAYGVKVNYDNEAVRFNANAIQYRDGVFRELTAAHESIYGLAALFNASKEVSADEFRLISADLLSRLGFILQLTYMPRVDKAGRAAFEAEMREDGHAEFRIHAADGATGDSPIFPDSLFPVRYLEPIAPATESLLGLNVLSEPDFARAADNAVVTAAVAALAQDQGGPGSTLMLVKALYQGREAPPQRVRRNHVSGLLAVMVDVPGLLAALPRAAETRIRLTLDTVDDAQSRVLSATADSPTGVNVVSLPSLRAEYALAFPDHTFLIEFEHTIPWAAVWHGSVWVALATGLILTALLYNLANSVVARTRELRVRNQVIADVVERQTAELKQDKESLQREVEVRRAAEHRLRQQQSALLTMAVRDTSMDSHLDIVLTDICCASADTLNVARVSVWMYDVAYSELRCVATGAWGAAQQTVEGRVLCSTDFPAYFQALGAGRVIAADDARTDERTRELRRAYLEPQGVGALLEAPVRRGGQLAGVVCHEHVGGERRWFLDEQSFASSVADMVTLALEMDDRRRTEAQMIKLSSALENTADSVFITDSHGVIEYVNPAFTVTTGYTREELLGQTPRVVRSGKHTPQFYAQLWKRIRAGRDFRDILINRRKDGSLYYEEKTITPLRNQRGQITHFVSTGKDITERMQTQERLHYLAHHDVLTELPNRSLFMDRLTHAIDSKRRDGGKLAVLFMDLDRFKNVNDTLGHEAGDLLLQSAAERLLGCVRAADTVARLGGDEFTLLIEVAEDQQRVQAVAQKVLAALADPIVVYGHELFVTASIGISTYPDDGQDASELLKHADTAMYKAKENGRDGYHFYAEGMSSRAATRLALEANLRRALDREEFVLFYQPQLDIRTGRVVAAEALIRWERPDQGMVPPDDFIPLLEDTGLIVPVGEWVLKTACAQARQWQRAAGVDLRIAVNLSARQFADVKLAGRIEQILQETGCAPALLDLEITESIIMQQADAAVAVMQRLRGLGVRVAIDDFGTGYSSLSYLKQFPIHTLKVDRSFIRDITSDPDDAAIVQSVVAMAHALKLDVVAEGVETDLQEAFLRDCDCDTVQGYLYAEPMSAEAFGGYYAQARKPVSG